jgi:predicted phosphodiesterase
MVRLRSSNAHGIGHRFDFRHTGLLRSGALDALRGSNLIIHAGDVGKPEIIDQLRPLAPVVAVRGNIDKGDWTSQLPVTAIVEAGPALIYVIHDIGRLDLDPAAAAFKVVVSDIPISRARVTRMAFWM